MYETHPGFGFRRRPDVDGSRLEKPDGQWAGTRPFRSAPRPPSVLLPSAQSVRAPTARAGGALRPGGSPHVVDFA